MKNRNKTRTEVSKFYKLQNGQWLKIVFASFSRGSRWFMDICVADSKRKCNDCIHKPSKSPKRVFGEHTGNNAGLEPFIIALKSLLAFELTVKNTEIRILGFNSKLTHIYSRLVRYGYTVKTVKCADGISRDMTCKYV